MQANAQSIVATRQDVEKLKADWVIDPCYDLFDIHESDPSLTPYKDELAEFQKSSEEAWSENRKNHIRNKATQHNLSMEQAERLVNAENAVIEAKRRAANSLQLLAENSQSDMAANEAADLCSDLAVWKMKIELLKNPL